MKLANKVKTVSRLFSTDIPMHPVNRALLADLAEEESEFLPDANKIRVTDSNKILNVDNVKDEIQLIYTRYKNLSKLTRRVLPQRAQQYAEREVIRLSDLKRTSKQLSKRFSTTSSRGLTSSPNRIS